MKASLPLSIIAACFIGLAGGAQAAVMQVVPDALGLFSVTDTTPSGPPNSPSVVYDFQVVPTTNPNPVVFYDTNPPTNQSAASILGLVATNYAVNPNTLYYTGGCDSIQGGCTGLTTTNTTFSLTNVPSFDYLAIHMGNSELLFHWTQPITSMMLTAFDGWPGGLSNYRTYATTPIPGAFALFLTALGLFGVGRKVAGRSGAQQPATA